MFLYVVFDELSVQTDNPSVLVFILENLTDELEDALKFRWLSYSLFHGFWQSFVTTGSCNNHLMRIISTYVGNTEKSEIS